MRVNCFTCNKQFEMQPYRIKNYKKNYCSRVCQHMGLFKPKVKKTCTNCQKIYYIKRSDEKWHKIRKHKHGFCSKNCKHSFYSAQKAINWKGGKYVNDRGYILIHSPNHPRKVAGSYMYEHRLVIEQKIGRFLEKGEDVHHINGNRIDNRIENLELITDSNHAKLHWKQRKINKINGQLLKNPSVQCGFLG